MLEARINQMNLSTFHMEYDSLRNRTLNVIYGEHILCEANKSLFQLRGMPRWSRECVFVNHEYIGVGLSVCILINVVHYIMLRI
jgi:hypothetical protein